MLEWFRVGNSHIPLVSRTIFLVSFDVTLKYTHLRPSIELKCPMCIWIDLTGLGRMHKNWNPHVHCDLFLCQLFRHSLLSKLLLNIRTLFITFTQNPSHLNYSYISCFTLWSLFYYFVHTTIFPACMLVQHICVLLSEARWRFESLETGVIDIC